MTTQTQLVEILAPQTSIAATLALLVALGIAIGAVSWQMASSNFERGLAVLLGAIVLFGSVGLTIDIHRDRQAHNKELVDMVLNPAAEFSLTEDSRGKTLEVKLPAVLEESTVVILGKKTPVTRVVREEQVERISGKQLENLLSSGIQLASGQSLGDLIASGKSQ